MLLVTVTLLLKFAQLKVSVINFFLQKIPLVALLCNISLCGEDFGLTSVNLLTSCGYLRLQVVVVTVFFIEKETRVVNLFSKHVRSACVCIVALFKVVVLQKLFVLQVAVLCLDGIKLISKSKVVLVPLLNFEDFSLEL